MAEPTTYVVLHKWTRPTANTSDSVSGAATTYATTPSEAWVLVAEIDATRREDAARAYVEGATDLPEGEHEFKAVAKSAWGEAFPFTISTQRVVAAKKKEPANA